MALIEKKELGLGKNGMTRAVTSALLMPLLGLNRINRIYRSLERFEGESFPAAFLRSRKISCSIDCGELSSVPEKGGLIVVSNHPYGGLDGLILLNLFLKIRPDVKFMGNELLSRIKPIAPYFIETDPYHPTGPKNIQGLRQCREHLSRGGTLIVFPSTSVATFQKGFTHLEDAPWNESLLKFIRNSDVSVLPVFIGGSNSRFFHLAGKIHPLVRTALLPRELLGKYNCTVRIGIGTPLAPYRLRKIPIREYGWFLRNNVELMDSFSGPKTVPVPSSPEPDPSSVVDMESVRMEIERLPDGYRVYSHPRYPVYLAPADDIPHTEAWLRSSEKQEKGTDPEESDGRSYLLVWDSGGSRPAAYSELGTGRRSGAENGSTGFRFTRSFRLHGEMAEKLPHTVEIRNYGFIPGCEPAPAALSVLWRALRRWLSENGTYRYLIGTFVVPGHYRPVSRVLIRSFILNGYYDYESAQNVSALFPPPEEETSFDLRRLNGIHSLEDLDKIVTDMEGGKRGVPAPVRAFLSHGGRVLSFGGTERAGEHCALIFFDGLS